MASPRIGGFNVLRMEDVPARGEPTGGDELFVATPDHQIRRHHPRKRMIQYSRELAIEPKSRGVLDIRFRGV
jgi:hypothetical protein